MRPAFVEDDRLSAVIHLVGQKVWDGVVIHDLLERAGLGQGVAVFLANEVQRLLNGERRLPLDVSYVNGIRVLAVRFGEFRFSWHSTQWCRFLSQEVRENRGINSAFPRVFPLSVWRVSRNS